MSYDKRRAVSPVSPGAKVPIRLQNRPTVESICNYRLHIETKTCYRWLQIEGEEDAMPDIRQQWGREADTTDG